MRVVGATVRASGGLCAPVPDLPTFKVRGRFSRPSTTFRLGRRPLVEDSFEQVQHTVDPEVYLADNYPHGMMCGNESCAFVFSDGDMVYFVAEAEDIFLAVCESCFQAQAEAEDPRVMVAFVASKHEPDGGYGETSWNPETRTVMWVCADWTGIDEYDAAEAEFLAIPGVENFESCAECAPPLGEDWEIVYPEGMTASGTTFARKVVADTLEEMRQPAPAGITREELAELLAAERTATFAEAQAMVARTVEAATPTPMHLLASAIDAMRDKPVAPVHFHYEPPDVHVDVQPAHLTVDVAAAEAPHVDVHVPEQRQVVVPAPVVEVNVQQPKPLIAVPIRDPETGQIIRVEHRSEDDG